MCGIAGVYNFNKKPVSKDLVKKITDIVAHRGPDDEGVYVDGFIGLGHRRLSIIDVSPAGHQPMCNEDSSIWITCDGAIYNFKQLRENLKRKGHFFKSDTDTEVIIHLYEEYGKECLSYLEGMFAFAIWDNRRGSLFLARDRLGMKPLFYTQTDREFIFSSEIKSLLEAGVFRRINLKALDNYITLGFVPFPQTIFEGIYKLPPGYRLTLYDGRLQSERYWEISLSPNFYKTEYDFVEELRRLLRDSVEACLMDNISAGAFLSSGIDSSIIVGMMSEIMQEPVKTFTLNFGIGYATGEAKCASRIADHLGTEHHNVALNPISFNSMNKLVYYLDEPMADPAMLAIFTLSEYAKKHVPVVFTGDGGDELFAGYDKHLRTYLTMLYSKVPSFMRKKVINKAISILPGVPRKVKRFMACLSLQETQQFHTLYYDTLSFEEKQDLYTNRVKAALSIDEADDPLAIALREVNSSIPIEKMFYLDIKMVLPELFLMKTDRMSMANSLEIRAPFLNHKLVEFSTTIPTSLKLRGLKMKYLLKKIASNLIPHEILAKKKYYLVVPLQEWFRGTLREYISQILMSDQFRERGYFNYHYIEKILGLHLKGQKNYSSQLFTLIVFELWCRNYLEGLHK